MIRKIIDFINFILCVIMATAGANAYFVVKVFEIPAIVMVGIFFASNILPFFPAGKYHGRIRVCNHGVKCLKIFMISTVASVVINIALAVNSYYEGWQDLVIGIVVCTVAELIILWNGIISVYISSSQLGIKRRVMAAMFSMIPILNIVVLSKIIKVVGDEVKLETKKNEINEKRKEAQVCKTKYPILMVHGVFFRDSEYFNYWGRIPEELEKNGATVYYGEHQSAASVADSAAELSERIKKIVAENDCNKLNIIAHSKGGLDCRYAIEHFGIGEYVASLTTINSPHRGCKFADYLLGKISESMQNKMASAYNSALQKLGDKNPDFIAAVRDLTSEKALALDSTMPIPENIYCQSVGSKVSGATSGKFPLNVSYNLVKYFDGANDGLVGEDSFEWGENYTFLSNEGKRGISHADVIDLNRENIPGFDVREWYVNLVEELKTRGL